MLIIQFLLIGFSLLIFYLCRTTNYLITNGHVYKIFIKEYIKNLLKYINNDIYNIVELYDISQHKQNIYYKYLLTLFLNKLNIKNNIIYKKIYINYDGMRKFKTILHNINILDVKNIIKEVNENKNNKYNKIMFSDNLLLINITYSNKTIEFYDQLNNYVNYNDKIILYDILIINDIPIDNFNININFCSIGSLDETDKIYNKNNLHLTLDQLTN